MGKKYITEDEVKKILGIDSFRNLSKDKIVEFISILPNIEKDIALSAINQFPAYTELAGTMISKMTDMCETALKENSSSQKGAIDGYLIILNSYSEQIKNDTLTESERKTLNKEMIRIADKLSAKDTENKNFIMSVVKTGGAVLTMALLIGGALLGVNINARKIE